MSKIRVAFVLGQTSWLGGVNYFRNLFTAIQSMSDSKLHPVIFTGLSSDLSAFDGLAEIVRTPILESKTYPWWANRILKKIFLARDYQLYCLMKKNNIDLTSHYIPFWKGCSIPSIGWIPDFQHLHLPNFFNKSECIARDKQFKNLIRQSDALILSSQDALNDLNNFCPSNSTPTYILQFASCLTKNKKEFQSREKIVDSYKLDRPWFHIPNQFWAHKNHSLVIEALNLLKSKGINPLVIASGSSEDYRNVEYYPMLIKRIHEYKLHDNFRVLGIVPYADVTALMKYSIAVINPSFFEGWSTSVEEAKSMGKTILLSDIAVHREQNPARGLYFNPSNEVELAEHIKQTLSNYDEDVESHLSAQAIKDQESHISSFAKEFEKICQTTVRNKL